MTTDLTIIVISVSSHLLFFKTKEAMDLKVIEPDRDGILRGETVKAAVEVLQRGLGKKLELHGEIVVHLATESNRFDLLEISPPETGDPFVSVSWELVPDLELYLLFRKLGMRTKSSSGMTVGVSSPYYVSLFLSCALPPRKIVDQDPMARGGKNVEHIQQCAISDSISFATLYRAQNRGVLGTQERRKEIVAAMREPQHRAVLRLFRQIDPRFSDCGRARKRAEDLYWHFYLRSLSSL